MGTINAIVDEKDIKKIIRQNGFDIRAYQIDIVSRLLKNLAIGGNSLVNIPQGMGKTFISQLAGLLSLKFPDRKGSKILYIIPTRALFDQHWLMAQWMRRYVDVYRASPDEIQDSFVMRRRFKSATMIVTTPIYFHNHLVNFDHQDLSQVKMVVLDEIDLFTVQDWEKQEITRPHATMFKIVERFIDRGAHFIGLTASRLPAREQDFWRKHLNYEVVQSASTDMKDSLPFTRLVPVELEAPRAIQVLDQALGKAMGLGYGILEDAGIHDPSLARLRRLTRRQADSENDCVQLAATVVEQARFARLQLFEDSLDEAKVSSLVRLMGRAMSVCNTRASFSIDELFGVGQQFLSNSSDHPKKRDWIFTLLEQHPSEKGVIFCRYRVLAEELAVEASRRGLDALSIHGDLNRREMFRRLAAFQWRSSPSKTFITRQLGGRGLDFPFARFAVLFSPQADVDSVNQETCRIRSNRADTKPVYLFFYSSTSEEEKASALINGLAQIRHGKRFRGYSVAEESNVLIPAEHKGAE